MKRILEFSTICTITLVLAGCDFPSQNLYSVDSCHPKDGCGVLMLDSELALVKETSGDNWRLWQKKPTKAISEVCTGTIEGNEFGCDLCGPGRTFTLTKAESSDCNAKHCVKFSGYGDECPNGGSGTGGHN